MSTQCNKCETTFDGKFCPNCGTPAQPRNNQYVQQMPPRMPPPQMPQNSPYQNNQFRPNINTLPSKKKHGCLFWGAIICVIIIGVIIFSALFISCFREIIKDGSNDETNNAISTDVNNGIAVNEDAVDVAESLTPSITNAPDLYLSEDEIQYLYTDTRKYKGRYVKLFGKIFIEPERDEKGVYFQMWQNAANNENNTFVVYLGELDISEGDYVIVDGIVKDTIKGKNAFGGTIIAPKIIAKTVELSSYQDVIAPAEKTIEVSETQEQYGYKLILEKVEFAKDETRVHLTVNNNGKSNFSIYSFNMKIIQNKKQYENQSNWEADYPSVQTDLYPDTTTSGIVCFPALSQTDDFVIYIDGSSDNWEEDIEEYKFTVKAE